MRYKKRGTYQNLEEYIYAKTGWHGSKRYQDFYHLEGLVYAADRIMHAVKTREHIEIHTDYDADGVGAAAEIILILRKLGAKNYKVTVPRRFSDGYGLQERHVSQMRGGLLITIDNGISAILAIQKAKANNMDVIVLDHHLALVHQGEIILPNADIIIDPAALPYGNDFVGYCGAGLVNCLGRYLFPNDREFQAKLASIAAVSTIADNVPLLEDNCRIVQEGLWAINHNMATAGLQAVMRLNELAGHVTSEDLAYCVAPIFNAPGRLYDKGALLSAATMFTENQEKAEAYAAQISAANEQRKQVTKQIMDHLDYDADQMINIIRVNEHIPGILGLIAGRIAENTKKPTFVYCIHNGIATGSARTDDGNNVKAMLDSVQGMLIKYGGHVAAAGFSFYQYNELQIIQALRGYPVTPYQEEYFYDLDIKPEDSVDLLHRMSILEPFGKEVERPVFRMECRFEGKSFWKPMGNGEHISFKLGELKAAGFYMRDAFKQAGYPDHIVFYGDLNWNWYKGNPYPNFRIQDFETVI